MAGTELADVDRGVMNCLGGACVQIRVNETEKYGQTQDHLIDQVSGRLQIVKV